MPERKTKRKVSRKCQLDQPPQVSREEAIKIGNKLGVDWTRINLRQFTKGMNVELEHRGVTKGSYLKTGKITLDHLNEVPDYYDRIEVIESPGFMNVARSMGYDFMDGLRHGLR